MSENDDMYCILCHGRGLDSHDKTCRRCGGTGYEPDTFSMGRGPAGCQAFLFPSSTAAPSRLQARDQAPDGSTPSPGSTLPRQGRLMLNFPIQKRG